MKKSLIITLALVFVLGIAGTAFAANPFVDVPANHWAYGAVSKLAKAGIVNGMGDGTYQGSANMTRYEMAQIVAKAMTKVDSADTANKALIEKLEAEFAAELNNLGVRVKALEDKVGTVAFSGDARIAWAHYGSSDTQTVQRLRLNMNAKANENTSFYGRIVAMNNNEFGTTGTNDKNQIIDAALTTRNFLNSGVTATVGRFSQKLLQVGYFADTDGMVDGAKIEFGNKVKMTVGYADFGATSDLWESLFINADYALSKATTVSAMYVNETEDTIHEVWGVGFTSKLNKDWYLAADYCQNRYWPDNPAMYVGRLGYKAADQNIVGSWGGYVEYLKSEYGALEPELSGASVPIQNVKGWNVKLETTLAKNIVLEAWQTFNQEVASTGFDAKDYTRVQVNFYF